MQHAQQQADSIVAAAAELEMPSGTPYKRARTSGHPSDVKNLQPTAASAQVGCYTLPPP